MKILFINPRFPNSSVAPHGHYRHPAAAVRADAPGPPDRGSVDAAGLRRRVAGRERQAARVRHRRRRGGDLVLEHPVRAGASYRAGVPQARQDGRGGRALPLPVSRALHRRPVRRGLRRRGGDHLAAILRRPPVGHSSSGLQAGRQRRHHAVAGAAGGPGLPRRLPLLLPADHPGLPLQVRVLRHHHHRRAGAAHQERGPRHQGDRSRTVRRRNTHQLLRRQPHRQHALRRGAADAVAEFGRANKYPINFSGR